MDLSRESVATGAGGAWLRELPATCAQVNDTLVVPGLRRLAQRLAKDLGVVARPVLEAHTQGDKLGPRVTHWLDWLTRTAKLKADRDAPYKESGLLGVSGLSADMRTLEASPHPDAQAAIRLFVSHITRELGGLAATLGGLDALVFTGGIGEHSTAIRQQVCEQAAWLGIELDPAANLGHGACISTPGSRTSAWVIATDEQRMLAQHAQGLLRQRHDS